MKLEAASRLMAFNHNSVTKTSEWRGYSAVHTERAEQLTVIGCRDEKPVGKIEQYPIFKDGREYLVVDFEASRVVAILDVDGNHVRSAAVNPKYQGHGIGFRLYEFCLKTHGTLMSSSDLSRGSSALWAKLVTKYKGHLRIPQDYGPDIDVQVYGFKKSPGGFTWPVVKREGKMVPIYEVIDQSLPWGDEEQAAIQAFYYVVRK